MVWVIVEGVALTPADGRELGSVGVADVDGEHVVA